MKRLDSHSQHFLRNPRFVRELVGHTSLKKSDTVYDIGAGSGVISSVLAERCQRIIAVEVEPRTAEKLRANMVDYPNVSVYEGDFLTMPLPKTPYKIFANIPFHLSSPILHKITEAAHPPVDTYLIVQKQFANKLLPDHKGFTSQLGILIGPEFAVRIRRPLRRTDFWPHPNVDTVLLEIKHRDEALIEPAALTAYRQFVVRCFTDPKYFSTILQKMNLVLADKKPSQLTLPQWIAMFQLLEKVRDPK
jgi:23S rRNA (adenine-N6)-dimethyltransferase